MTAIIKIFEDDYDLENVKEHPVGTITLRQVLIYNSKFLKLHEEEIQFFEKVYVTNENGQVLSEDKDFLFDKPQVYRLKYRY
ncbi:hypothetical protein pb186bvf_019020 [Paramecium bursaria]